MPLNEKQVVEQARILYGYHLAERERLDLLRQYWKGCQARPAAIPTGSPNEVTVMARSSRVNIMPIVINSLVQSTFVDGFRAKLESDDAEVWKAWQANKMDARQTGIHRATFGFGAAYTTVLPGDPFPVIGRKSPRVMTTLYGEDPDWPMWGLERLGNGLFRLWDDGATYYVEIKDRPKQHSEDYSVDVEYISSGEHGMDVCPIVRFLDEDDLDADDEVEPAGDTDVSLRGQVAPLMALQDQIDMATFGLQIAQHYGAFRQRWIIGWTADSEEATLKAAASRLWTFDESPDGEDGMKLGEFEQTDLDGYIKSRETSLRHGATLSQTPVHELTGQLVNLSAEALAAAEAGRDRKVDERQTLLGESHEQTLTLVGRAMNAEVPADAQVRWRDTSARSFAATVDGLGKLATMLNIPPQELWERIPGVTKQDIDRWKAAQRAGDSFTELTKLLERQAA